MPFKAETSLIKEKQSGYRLMLCVGCSPSYPKKANEVKHVNHLINLFVVQMLLSKKQPNSTIASSVRWCLGTSKKARPLVTRGRGTNLGFTHDVGDGSQTLREWHRWIIHVHQITLGIRLDAQFNVHPQGMAHISNGLIPLPACKT